MDAPPVAGLGSPGVPAVMSPAVPNVSGGGGGGGGAGDDEVREQDRYLPVANIARIMKVCADARLQ
jgi:hypothetical protein